MINPVTKIPTASDDEFSEVIANELALLEPATRAKADAVIELLHEEFREFGASGRIWDRPAIVSVLAAGPGTDTHAEDMRAVRLAPDAVLLTYVARKSDRTTLRSSVWIRQDSQWRLLFHQGTICGHELGGPP